MLNVPGQECPGRHQHKASAEDRSTQTVKKTVTETASWISGFQSSIINAVV